MLELAQTCNTRMTILSFLKCSFTVKKDILILQLISISILTIPQKGHSLFAKWKITGILAMVFTKSNPQLGKTASSKIFQLNGASSRHGREKEYYLTETTGHCFAWFLWNVFTPFSLSEAILSQNEWRASKENNWSSFPSQKNSHECLKKKKKSWNSPCQLSLLSWLLHCDSWNRWRLGETPYILNLIRD